MLPALVHTVNLSGHECSICLYYSRKWGLGKIDFLKWFLRTEGKEQKKNFNLSRVRAPNALCLIAVWGTGHLSGNKIENIIMQWLLQWGSQQQRGALKGRGKGQMLALDGDGRLATCLGTANLDRPGFKASFCTPCPMLTGSPCPISFKCRRKPPAPTRLTI